MGLPAEIDPLLISTTAVSSYQIGRSLRFRSSASAYLNRTPASAGNRKTWTWSGWVKRGTLGVNQHIFGGWDGSNNATGIYFATNDTIEVFSIQISPTTYSLQLDTTQVFRDPSAWYHFVLAIDTTQATASNRAKLYVNGSQITALSTASYPSQNSDLFVNTNSGQFLCRMSWSSASYLDGYLAEVNFIDGQALTPSSFGSTDVNGIWQPKKYTGTYGTNGFYLPFSDTSSTTNLVTDSSGNANNWTPNNISLTAGTTYDSMQDVPTNNSASAANFAVLNPLDKNTNIALSNGNLTAIPSSTADYWLCRATMAFPSSGKWYWELTLNNTPYLYQAGIYSSNRPTNGATSSTGNEYQVAWGTAYTYIQYQSNNAAFAAWGTNTNPTNGDVLMFAVDSGNSTMWIGRNGTWYNTSGTANPATNTDPRFSSIPSGMFAGVNLPNPASGGVSLNFGQRPFSYTPPTGFNALNTANLPTPLISNGAQYMAATLYTGTGSNITIANSQSNGGNNPLGKTFYPDFVWTKGRSAATNNIQIDSVRGGANYLISDSTSAEVNNAAAAIQSFSSTGYVMGTGGAVNTNGATYVGWQWNAGSGTTSTNTSGSITSTVSVNQTAGFSVVTYTGTGANATVGHGLGVAPSMIIIKNRTLGTENWAVYHTSTGAAYWLLLSGTNAAINNTTIWQNTSPTSSVFSLGPISNSNVSGSNFVAYCFAAVSSYSAFGSYTGNGSADGPFVFTNFRPRFVLIKDTAGIADWNINDSSRDTYNQMAATLFADASSAESTQTAIDFLSNGFKIRGSTGQKNSSGTTYIYAAFAENPFNYSRAR